MRCRLIAINFIPGSVSSPVAPRLDAKQEFSIQKLLPFVIQQQRIDAISKREIHRGCDKYVIPTVSVEIADARSPGPVILRSHAVGDLRELAVSQIVIQTISEDKTVCLSHQKRFGGV